MGDCVRLVAGGSRHRRCDRQGHRRQDCGRPHDDHIEHVVEHVNDDDNDRTAGDHVNDGAGDDDNDDRTAGDHLNDGASDDDNDEGSVASIRRSDYASATSSSMSSDQ